MGIYHLIGEPFIERPQIFELRLSDHIVDINPDSFGMDLSSAPGIPSLDPHSYYITSGDAVAKTIKLKQDLQELAERLYSGPAITGWPNELTCPICSKRCTSTSGKTLHLKKCEKKYKKLICPHCSKKCSSKPGLVLHIKKCPEKPKQPLEEYKEAVQKAAKQAVALVKKLKDARAEDCFLETEWRNHSLLCIPKNPRKR